MKYNPSLLLAQLSPIADCSCLVVALSGGLDSMVLLISLHQLCREGELDQKLRAIHINHGINPGADDWQAFCEASCRRLKVPLDTVQLELGSMAIDNLEERARNARYDEFESRLGSDDCLLMGHHRDDQMETLLLRLMRGSGPKGLAGIPITRKLGNSKLLRPLLIFDRSALRQYALHKEINWIEDDSNQSIDFDRNYLRLKIMPLLGNRWPGYRESWDKSLQLSQEAELLLTELAELDLESVVTKDRQVINLAALTTLNEPRQRNLLRYWLTSIGFPSLGWQRLLKLSREIISARPDSSADLSCGDGKLQRYREELYALKKTQLFNPEIQGWNLHHQLSLGLPGNGQLSAALRVQDTKLGSQGGLLRADIGELTVCYRNGGEAFRPAKRPTKSLKSLLQEAGIAPWFRDRQPLIFLQDKLVCIPGIGVGEEFSVEAGESGYKVSWKPPNLLYVKAE